MHPSTKDFNSIFKRNININYGERGDSPYQKREYLDMYCKYCGNSVSELAEICPSCGRRLKQIPWTSEKGYYTILVLSIILGWAGFHYFYVKKYYKGFIYLFTFGLFIIGWIVDIFRIKNEQFKDVTGNTIRKPLY
jgi:hypothetical protein